MSGGSDSGVKISQSATSVGSVGDEPRYAPSTPTKTIPVEPIVQLKKYTANDFKFIKTLGDGSFATVYLAKEITSGRNYAVKVCEKRQILREKREAYIKREREVLSVLNANPSPFFVKLFCTFQDTSRLYFVITYAKNGELLTYIIKVNCFDTVCTQFYTAEVILALEHLHSLGIIHRDIKPENILLNENMHILITDFGSAAIEGQPSALDVGSAKSSRRSPRPPIAAPPATPKSSEDEFKPLDARLPSSTSDTSRDEADSTEAARTRHRSFVGTADYVPPEMLTDKQSSRATDLWALGCLIYQLLAGLPPFRAATDYHIFQKIMQLDYTFPEGFDLTAQDLVRKLLVREPSLRLGHEKCGGFARLKKHKFFDGISDWDNLHAQKAPVIAPSLASSDFPERSGSISVAGLARIEPGLDDRQLTRLMGLSLQDNVDGSEKISSAPPGDDGGDFAASPPSEVPSHQLPSSPSLKSSQQRASSKRSGSSANSAITALLNLPDDQRRERIFAQARSSPEWHRFAENNLILKQGFVDKKKGLFPRRRMLLLTTGPHLYYVDPISMVLKGEIPWSADLRPEAKTFKIFFIHTANRTYYLIDPSNNAVQWCEAVEDVYVATYGLHSGGSGGGGGGGGGVGNVVAASSSTTEAAAAAATTAAILGTSASTDAFFSVPRGGS